MINPIGKLKPSPRLLRGKLAERLVFPPFEFGQSAQLNGVGQYLEAPSLAEASFPDQFAVGFWINPLASASSKLLFNTRLNRALQNEVGLDTFGPGGAIRIYATNAGGTRTFRDSGYTLSSGNKYYVYADWCVSLQRYRLFINGALIAQDDGVSTWPANIVTIALSSSNFVNGKYDSIAIWHRCLSLHEVAMLYNGGAGLAPTSGLSLALKGYWPCESRIAGSPVTTPSGFVGGPALNAPADFSQAAW